MSDNSNDNSSLVTLTVQELINLTAHAATQEALTDTRKELEQKIDAVRTELSNDIKDVRTEIKDVRNELSNEIKDVRNEINAKFDSVNAKFDSVNAKFDRLQWLIITTLLGVVVSLVMPYLSTAN
ncbi:DUF1640 domain-containing protein [Vibrio mediterranei]|uniref:DUF1640 domain-containing protein n=1 Tax=Vibrio mediterranei TaxID=689 RepID=UPI001EFCB0EC|nr:DUF1640 domain-containing protein [Vibrio mediterranei]MCG9660588.1 DUF1640 domain-containing protein [Vibrio mediterranei]